MSVTLYVEGGGKGKALRSALRRGFSSLLSSAGFTGRMPRVVAGGSRNSTFDSFATAHASAADRYPMMLVDSESTITAQGQGPAVGWQHLEQRDGWSRPPGTADDQAQLMVTCMETWLLADRNALERRFPGLASRRLLSPDGLEQRSTSDIQSSLRHATETSSRGHYEKSRDSFDLIGSVDPDVLRDRLPHFGRFLNALQAHAA